VRSLEVALIEWPDGREAGGPLVIGHLTDPEIVARVRDLLAAARRRDLRRLEPPVRSIPDDDLDGEVEP
jgi:hypothetical protein